MSNGDASSGVEAIQVSYGGHNAVVRVVGRAKGVDSRYQILKCGAATLQLEGLTPAETYAGQKVESIDVAKKYQKARVERSMANRSSLCKVCIG